MTSGIIREPSPGDRLAALDTFGYRVARQGAQLDRLAKRNPNVRPIPAYRLDEMTNIPPGDPVDVYGVPATQQVQSFVFDLVLPAGTYGTISVADDLGELASIDLLPGTKSALTLTATRVAIGDWLTVTGQVTNGTGTMQMRVRAAFG